MYRVLFWPTVVYVPSNCTGQASRAHTGDMQMFTKQGTTDRIDNDSFVASSGAAAMLNKSISTHNRILKVAVVIAVAVIVLVASAAQVSADNDNGAGSVPLTNFRALTADAPWVGSLEEAGQGHASVINMAAFYADTIDAPDIG
jgi:hypothetical protein